MTTIREYLERLRSELNEFEENGMDVKEAETIVSDIEEHVNTLENNNDSLETILENMNEGNYLGELIGEIEPLQLEGAKILY